MLMSKLGRRGGRMKRSLFRRGFLDEGERKEKKNRVSKGKSLSCYNELIMC